MASMLARAGRGAFRTTRPLFNSSAEISETAQAKANMTAEAKRNPELYILGGVMTFAFAGAGYYFSQNPTSASSETKVSQVKGSEPWKTGKAAKYEYFPHGDPLAGRRDAPSPLHVAIVPNVNLPKSLHEQFNKYGKDDYP